MKPAILAGLIFWGTMARVLSELMTWSWSIHSRGCCGCAMVCGRCRRHGGVCRLPLVQV